MTLTIGDLGKATATKVETIRYTNASACSPNRRALLATTVPMASRSLPVSLSSDARGISVSRSIRCANFLPCPTIATNLALQSTLSPLRSSPRSTESSPTSPRCAAN